MPLLLPGLVFLGGCFGGRPVDFPAGLEPLESNQASWPVDGGEELSFVVGRTDDYDWAHARGYVHAPIEEVYAAITTPEVDVDRREVDEWEVSWDVEPDYAHSYTIHNTVYDIITVDFDVTWRHGAIKGSEADPEVVASRFQKTAGSSVISLMEGSVVLSDEGPERCAIELEEHLASLSSDTDTLRSYLGDLFADVVATVHGEELPTYE